MQLFSMFKFRHYADNMQNLSTWEFYKQKKRVLLATEDDEGIPLLPSLRARQRVT